MKQLVRASAIGLLTLILFSGITAAANWTVYQGDKLTISNANSSLKWGQDYSFNATGLQFYTDSLEINMTNEADRNISITSDTPDTINSTLYRYDLSGNPPLGDTLIKVQTSAISDSTVDFEFTGIPGISSDHYVLDRDGSQQSTYGSGGTISWSDSSWDSNHNFTLAYREKPSGGGGNGDNTGGRSISGSILTGDLTDSHTWINTQKTRFNLQPNPEIGVEKITVETQKNQSSFQIQVKRHQTKPDKVPEIKDSYTYLEIETPGTPNNEISQTTIQFTVNQSYTQQYREIVLTRLHNGSWTPLNTQLIEKRDGQRVYEATAPGNSYYAVQGLQPIQQDKQQQQREQNQTTNTSQNRTQTNQTTDQQKEEDTDEQEPDQKELQDQKERRHRPSTLLIIGASIIALLTIIGYYEYREYRQHQIEQEANQIRQRIKQLDEHEIQRPEELAHLLQQAETSIENGEYNEAKTHLEQIQDLLE